MVTKDHEEKKHKIRQIMAFPVKTSVLVTTPTRFQVGDAVGEQPWCAPRGYAFTGKVLLF